MGSAASTQKVRLPENSLNPLLAAQTQTSAAPPARSANSSRQQLSKIPAQEPGLPSLLARTVLLYVLASHCNLASKAPGQWHLAVLSFLSQACQQRGTQNTISIKDEAESGTTTRGAGQPRYCPGRRGSSKYRGVSWHKGVGKWAVQLRFKGQNQQMGYFDDEEEAARVYDHHVIIHRPSDAPTNFPRPSNGKGYDLEGSSPPKRRKPEMHSSNQQKGSSLVGNKEGSPYIGVTYEKIRKLWRSQCYINGKTQYLGTFPTAKDAALAHDCALVDNNILSHKGLNFPEEAGAHRLSQRVADGISRASSKAEGHPAPEAGQQPAVNSPQKGGINLLGDRSSDYEDNAFEVPLRQGELDKREPGRTPSWSPEPGQASGSPTLHLDALAALCEDADLVDTAPARERADAALSDPGQLGQEDARHSGQPFNVSAVRPSIGGGPLVPLGNQIPALPMPRSRQRKPDKRKRVEPMEPIAGPSLTRGRGRTRTNGQVKGRSGSTVLVHPAVVQEQQPPEPVPIGVTGPRSQYHGVRWSQLHGCWEAIVMRGQQAVIVGTFDSEEEASHAHIHALQQLGLITEPKALKVTHRPSLATGQQSQLAEGRRKNRQAGQRRNPLLVSSAAALAKFGRVFEQHVVDADERISDTSDSDWEGSPKARRRGRARQSQTRMMRRREGKDWHGQSRAARRGSSTREGSRDGSHGPGGAATRPQRRRKSQFKGVSFEEGSNMWLAELRHHGQTTFLGRFSTELAASEAYTVAGRNMLGYRFPSNRGDESEVSGFSTATSGTATDDLDPEVEDDLLPPVPTWGRRVRLATHPVGIGSEVRSHAGQGVFQRSRKRQKSGLQKHAVQPSAGSERPAPAVAHQCAQPSAATLHNRSFAAPPGGHSSKSLTGSLADLQQAPERDATAGDHNAAVKKPKLQRPVARGGMAEKVAHAQGLPATAPSPAAEALGPVLLVYGAGSMHLTTDDPNTRAAVLAALRQPGVEGFATAVPASIPPGHVVTLSEEKRQVVEAALLRQQGKSMTASELLGILGLHVFGQDLEGGTQHPRSSLPPPPSANRPKLSSAALNRLSNQALGPLSTSIKPPPATRPLAAKEEALEYPEATRTAYTALLQQHMQTLATALARTSSSRPPFQVPEQATPQAGQGHQRQPPGFPQGFVGPHIPPALRQSGQQHASPAMTEAASTGPVSQPSSMQPQPSEPGIGFSKFIATGSGRLPRPCVRPPELSSEVGDLKRKYPALANFDFSAPIPAAAGVPGKGPAPQAPSNTPTVPAIGSLPASKAGSNIPLSRASMQNAAQPHLASRTKTEAAAQSRSPFVEAQKESDKDGSPAEIGMFKASQIGATSLKVPAGIVQSDAVSDKDKLLQRPVTTQLPTTKPGFSLPPAGQRASGTLLHGDMGKGIKIAPGGCSRVVSNGAFPIQFSSGKPSPSRVESGRFKELQSTGGSGSVEASKVPSASAALPQRLPTQPAKSPGPPVESLAAQPRYPAASVTPRLPQPGTMVSHGTDRLLPSTQETGLPGGSALSGPPTATLMGTLGVGVAEPAAAGRPSGGNPAPHSAGTQHEKGLPRDAGQPNRASVNPVGNMDHQTAAGKSPTAGVSPGAADNGPQAARSDQSQPNLPMTNFSSAGPPFKAEIGKGSIAQPGTAEGVQGMQGTMPNTAADAHVVRPSAC